MIKKKEMEMVRNIISGLAMDAGLKKNKCSPENLTISHRRFESEFKILFSLQMEKSFCFLCWVILPAVSKKQNKTRFRRKALSTQDSNSFQRLSKNEHELKDRKTVNQ